MNPEILHKLDDLSELERKIEFVHGKIMKRDSSDPWIEPYINEMMELQEEYKKWYGNYYEVIL